MEGMSGCVTFYFSITYFVATASVMCIMTVKSSV